MEALADPAYEQVVLSKAPGYEYKDEHGRVQGPFAAISFFTWALKGFLPPSIALRRPGRREFHPLSVFESEISIVARIQLTNLMLDRKEWFYLDASQQVQGPFSAADMTGYVATRYMKESVKFYGRAIRQENTPPPTSDALGFHTYGHLLNETMRTYRRKIKHWREATYGKETSTHHPHSRAMANGLVKGSGGALPDVASMRISPLPMLTPVPPSSIDSVTPIPELTFDELRDKYAHQLFADPEKFWYVALNGQIFGPCEELECHPQLGANTMLGSTRKNVPFCAEKQAFASFEEHLKRLHRAG